MIYHSIVWQYLPGQARAKGTRLITEAAERASNEAPLAWLYMESDGEEPGAGIHLRLWPSGEARLLGRADYHGRWIDWRGFS